MLGKTWCILSSCKFSWFVTNTTWCDANLEMSKTKRRLSIGLMHKHLGARYHVSYLFFPLNLLLQFLLK